MIKLLNRQGQKLSAMILTGAMIASGDVSATTTDLKTLTSNVGEQSSNIPQFINYACYITGVGLVGMGLFGFKKHVDNPQEKLPPALAKLFVGGALVATPAMIEVATGTAGLGAGEAAFDSMSTASPFGG